MSSKRGEGLKARVMTREKVRDYVCAFTHVPLQESEDILMIRSTRDRIEKCEDTRICVQNVLLFVSVSECVHVFFCVYVLVCAYCKQLSTWVTESARICKAYM